MLDFSPLYAAHTQVLDAVDSIITERIASGWYSPAGPSKDEQKQRLFDTIAQFKAVICSHPAPALFTATIEGRIYEIWLLGKLIMGDGDVDVCRAQISLQLDLMIEAVLDVR